MGSITEDNWNFPDGIYTPEFTQTRSPKDYNNKNLLINIMLDIYRTDKQNAHIHKAPNIGYYGIHNDISIFQTTMSVRYGYS